MDASKNLHGIIAALVVAAVLVLGSPALGGMHHEPHHEMTVADGNAGDSQWG
jgi:hypothetical protein